MKNIFLAAIALIILTGCQTDDFNETKRYFLTDKESYNLGDEFILTAVIEADKEKGIRYFKNFKKLEISFSLMNASRNVHNGSWSRSTGEFLGEAEIVEYEVMPGHPFEKKFNGEINSVGDQIMITIPEMNFKARFNKSEFDEHTILMIHGLAMPIDPVFGASLEDFFEPKDIRINE